jgi:predicted AAA+ superfamily ATPase
MLEKLFFYSNLFLNSYTPQYKRSIYAEINFNEKLIGLRGAKGVGKTTIIKQYLNSLNYSKKEILYVSIDNSIVTDKIIKIAEIAYKKGIKVIAFDEIHYQKDFENDLKTIYDFFDMQVIFSGSSAIALSNSDLSRRAVIYDVPILSFREFLELSLNKTFEKIDLDSLVKNHPDFASKITKKIKPLKYFDDYLKYGAYPFFLESNESTFYMKLLEVVNKTIESDLLYLFNIDTSNVFILKKLLLLLCENPPGNFNLTSLSREIGINIKTLYNYIEALLRGKLIHLLYYNKKGNALFQKPDKILLDNPNLFNVLCSNQNKGAIRESFFVSQLFKHNIRYSKQGDYIVDDKYIFEIGGKNKTKKQIKNLENAYIVKDDIEIGFDEIPLWLFGFLY